MQRTYHRWHSPSLGREMELVVFGHSGAPVIVFPTSHGRFYEFEDRQMVAALEYQINSGWFQLFCVDSVFGESWYNYAVDTDARMWREEQYEHYLLTELLPLIRALNPNHFLIATGCSFGATEAVIFALRHPGVVNRVIGMSGLYDLRRFFSHYTQGLYFHNPVDFVPNIGDAWTLDRLRSTEIILVTGRDDPNAWSNELLSRQLWERGIGNALRLWDGWCHDWPYWMQMINRYIGGHP
ncbi:esterase family protein [Candidatus Chloroploca sp. M-50]|uniref:Esterase family protein n=1 Tax=Candidatus Chloroploca mongolica TaxID=2528176 RepID=A0ABS4D4F5_9CHLR|nr:alpha/beta hydrolase-fold protein [Candidatus Chloroploca mongolica]MBP1464310.1 esterase family protein [Candidatus Chloroploca mongolica]